MVKSTPINQLPQGQNKLETYITSKHETDFINTQKAHEEFQQPVDTNNDITANTDADISINEVMSEINNNKEIELAENNRLQQQINQLQYQLTQQKQTNVPQSPSAHLVNEQITNALKLEQTQDVKLEPMSWYAVMVSFAKTNLPMSKNDFKLFVICCVLFWLLSKEKVSNILATNLSYITEDRLYLVKVFHAILFGTLVLSLFKI